MAGQPIAIIGSMHVCPMVTGYIPHVGGPVTGPGAPGVTVNGVPVSLMGDICTCVGAPDTIAQGCAGVTINGTPVATVGCLTAHGGSITVGSPGVLVGPVEPAANATMPVNSIPFPDISFVSKVLASVTGQADSLATAQANQEQLRNETETEEAKPVIIRAEFFDEESNRRIYHGKMTKTVKMRVFTKFYPDGETVTINLKRKLIRDVNGVKLEDEEVETLTGTVNGDVAIIEYEIPEFKNQTE